MARRILALFAKAPSPGRVKTRLVPPLSLAQAADLYEAMLHDVLAQHVDRAEADLALWYTPPEAAHWFERVAPAGYRLQVQEGNDLGPRMCALFRRHAAEGYDRIVLRGTDSPTLPPARVREAFGALERSELVLCPDRDGGYNLIGLRGPCDALFELEMSRSSLLDATLRRAETLGLGVELLPAHHDVDTAADLELLRASLRDPDACAPRTAAWLGAWSSSR